MAKEYILRVNDNKGQEEFVYQEISDGVVTSTMYASDELGQDIINAMADRVRNKHAPLKLEVRVTK